MSRLEVLLVLSQSIYARRDVILLENFTRAALSPQVHIGPYPLEIHTLDVLASRVSTDQAGQSS